MSEQDDRLGELLAHAEIGEAARDFLESDLGRCLLGIAQQEADSARIELETVDVENTIRIRELQNQCWRSRRFQEWLIELNNKGNEALEEYRREQTN